MPTSATGAMPALPLSMKILYAAGSAANGAKHRALAAFLLIFYNQVIGVSPALVSGAIMVVMIFDALFDPMVGQISDNFRHRWGRRHPFMYASAVPLGLAFFMIWNPPSGLADQGMAAYLLACLLIIRLFDTFYELPSSALLPELVSDYDQRTNLQVFRQLFNIVGQLSATWLAYKVFLAERPDGTGGIVSRDGYFHYGVFFGVLIAALILVSALSTRSRIPYLRQPPQRRTSPLRMFREMAETLRNRSLLALVAAGIFSATALGMRNGLDIYFALYFWELKQGQLATFAIAGAVGTLLGAPLAAFVIRKLGKRDAVIWGAGLTLGFTILPVTGRLLGLMPPNGSDSLFYILMGEVFIHMTLSMIPTIAITAMLADVVEDVELKTGRRSEGLILSADNLFKKLVSSASIMVVGLILTAASFPQNASRGGVPADVLQKLGLIYVPSVLTLVALYLFSISFYQIDRRKHQDNLDQLAARGR